MAKRILVIDDEKNLRTVIQACLEKIGRWQALIAQSGSEGLLLAKSQLPDVILLDVVMPDMDGLTLLRSLKSHPTTQKIPVILLTAKTQMVNLNELAQLDVAGVILKPFNPLKLPEQVASLLKWT
ncbi:response regulator [Scytonema sp. NUACC21]